MICSSLPVPLFNSIMLHLFTLYRDTSSGHAAVIADDTFYALSQYINVKNIAHVITFFSSQFLFSVYFYDIHNESAPAGTHILEQTMIVWRYTVQIYCLQAGVCK